MQICTRTADLHGIFTHFRAKTMQIRTRAADLHGFFHLVLLKFMVDAAICSAR